VGNSFFDKKTYIIFMMNIQKHYLSVAMTPGVGRSTQKARKGLKAAGLAGALPKKIFTLKKKSIQPGGFVL